MRVAPLQPIRSWYSLVYHVACLSLPFCCLGVSCVGPRRRRQVVDGVLGSGWAGSIRDEVRWLGQKGLLTKNRTQVGRGVGG